MSEFTCAEVLAENETRLVARGHLPDFGEVVVKQVKSRGQTREVSRLRQEFLILEAVRHENWVGALAYRELQINDAPSAPAIVLRPFAGCTLDRFPVSPGWTLQKLSIARQMLTAIDVLHRLDFVHLDLHPGQILLETNRTPGDVPEPRVVLLDLGLSAERATRITRRGTLGFVAPEVFGSARCLADPRADLFAFGLLLHYLAVGSYPVEGPLHERSVQHLRGVRPNFTPEIPRVIAELIADLLQPDPALRPQTATDAWRVIRDSVADIDLARFPPRLSRSASLPFRSRLGTIRDLLGDVEIFERSPGRVRAWHVDGEPGIGKKRTIERLAAYMETRGWLRTEPGDPRHIVLRREKKSFHLLAGSNVPCEPDGTVTPPELEVAETRLTVRVLDRLSEVELQRMIRGNRFESEGLVRAVTHVSLGNPGLMLGLIEQLPEELDLAGQGAGALTLEDHVEPPPIWSTWLHYLLAGSYEIERPIYESAEANNAPTTAGALLAVSLSDGQSTVEALEQVMGWPSGAILHALDGPIARGLVQVDAHPQGMTATLLSPLWKHVVEALDSDATGQVGQRLLRASDTDLASRPVQLVRIALRLRDPMAVRSSFPRALEQLSRDERHEDVLEMTVRVLGPSRGEIPILDRSHVEVVLESVYMSGTLLLPTFPAWLCEEDPAGLEATPHGALLRACACLGHSRSVEARDLVDSQRGQYDRPVLLLSAIFLRAIALNRLGVALEDVVRELDAYRAHPLFEAPPFDYRIRRLEVAFRMSSHDHGRLLTILESFPREVRATWSRADRAKYDVDRASVLFGQKGPLPELDEAMRTWEDLGCRALASLTSTILGGQWMESGQIERAIALNRAGFEQSIRSGNRGNAVHDMFNLAFMFFVQGRLTLALSAAQRAEQIAGLTGAGASLPRMMVAFALVHGGLHEEGCSIADQSIARAVSRKERLDDMMLAARGLARCRMGDSQRGRDDLEAAHDVSIEANEVSDAVESLLTRLEVEIEEGQIEEALRVHSRIRAYQDDVTPLTRAHADILEGELWALGWEGEEAPADLDQRLAELPTGVDPSAWRMYRWRIPWRRAGLARARGDHRRADELYDDAARQLLDLTSHSFDSRLANAYLRLPTSRVFLDELDGWRANRGSAG